MSWYVEEEDGDIRHIDDTVQHGLLFVQEHEATIKTLQRAVEEPNQPLPPTLLRPIGVNMNPPERVLALELIHTEEKHDFFKKVLAVFVYLCDEIHELEGIATSNLFPKLMMFGHPVPSTRGPEELQPGEAEEMIGRILPFLQELANFIERCKDVAVNLVQQLSRVYSSSEKLFQNTFQFVRLTTVYESLGTLLRVLATFDAIILENGALTNAWTDYKRMMQFVRTDPATYGVQEDRVEQFERLLVALDTSVFRGGVFKACVDMDFEELLPEDGDEGSRVLKINVRNNPEMLSEMARVLKHMLERDLGVVGTSGETDEKLSIVNSFCLYVLFRRLTPPHVEPDQRFYRKLWSVQKKVPFVVLCPNHLWIVSDFLEEYVRLEVKKLDPPDAAAHRRQFLEKFDDAFPTYVSQFEKQVAVWMVNMEAHFSQSMRFSSGDMLGALEARGSLLLKGLVIATKVSDLMSSLITSHLAMSLPMQRKVISPLCTCIELLKALDMAVDRKLPTIAESMGPIVRVLAARLLKFTKPVKDRVRPKTNKPDMHKLDVMAALNVVERLLHGSDSYSFARQKVLSMGLSISLNPNFVRDTESEQVHALVHRLCLLSNWQPLFRRACDCSFLVWNSALLSTFVQDVYSKPSQASRMHYIIAAFSDSARLLKFCVSPDPTVEEGREHLEAFQTFVLTVLDDDVVKPLCRDVENELRLEIHDKNQGTLSADMFNLKKNPRKELRTLLDLEPIRVYGKVVNIRQKVTHYLETIFYNLTTMALYDWMTYADMRNLAAEKFALRIADNHLPMGSLEYDQGLDVLMIMRNIHVFVSRFSYNLNQQNFVEKQPDRGSKNLNTINIQSIAASLRQHGLGILNTTVNFTYQFLAQKFHVFSQFLFDEYIKGHLSKERRWYRKHKHEVGNVYPFERAQKFVKEIRKLGVLENGRTFLDQFRILITEIGNALGYVRMVRSAGMHFCSEAVRFLPDIDNLIDFEAHTGDGIPASTAEEDDGEEQPRAEVKGAGFGQETRRAARNLDDIVGTLSRNFSEGSDYFKVLVSVFQQVLMTGDHGHLDNFYMIIPALCLSWVDASYQAKMYMYKANRTRDTYYTDDGFAVGLAYILAILNQGTKYDSLHWFMAVKEKLRADARVVEEQKQKREARRREKEKAAKAAKKSRSMFSRSDKNKAPVNTELDEEDEEEIHTMQQTENRLQATKRENDVLYFSLSGARIFFKR